MDCQYTGWGKQIDGLCLGDWRAVGVLCRPKKRTKVPCTKGLIKENKCLLNKRNEALSVALLVEREEHSGKDSDISMISLNDKQHTPQNLTKKVPFYIAIPPITSLLEEMEMSTIKNIAVFNKELIGQSRTNVFQNTSNFTISVSDTILANSVNANVISMHDIAHTNKEYIEKLARSDHTNSPSNFSNSVITASNTQHPPVMSTQSFHENQAFMSQESDFHKTSPNTLGHAIAPRTPKSMSHIVLNISSTKNVIDNTYFTNTTKNKIAPMFVHSHITEELQHSKSLFNLSNELLHEEPILSHDNCLESPDILCETFTFPQAAPTINMSKNGSSIMTHNQSEMLPTPFSSTSPVKKHKEANHNVTKSTVSTQENLISTLSVDDVMADSPMKSKVCIFLLKKDIFISFFLFT